MAEPKVTTMVIKVDLQCEKCYKKIKKVLCKFHEIRDQVYDEKQNTVTIKVLCGSPEKIKHKISSKGGKSVKSIEIVVPKPKETEKEPEKAKKPEKKEEPVDKKAPEKLKLPERPKDPVETPPQSGAQALATLTASPIGVWYEGVGAGSSYQGHGYPLLPVMVYDGYYGRPVYDSWGGSGYSGGYYVSNNPNYFSEENPSTCSIM